MAQISEYSDPGYFFILTQPKTPEDVDEYHQWYNTEHGPLRMKLDFVRSGYRYKSQDVSPPIWLAAYELDRISGLGEPQYKVLREGRSQREVILMGKQLRFVNRRVYKYISGRGHCDGPAPVIMTVTFVVKDALVDEVHSWYNEEHIPDLARIPGWRRSRRFELVEADDQKEGFKEFLAVHDFDSKNGLDGPEHQLAKSRPWRNRILELVESRDNKRFDFYHEFKASDYQEPPGINEVKASPVPKGPSCWHLEGPKDAQVLVFSNSLITDHHIWDFAIEQLKQEFPKFRYLVYNSRGYSTDPGCEVDINMLSDDLAQLLDYLGIQNV